MYFGFNLEYRLHLPELKRSENDLTKFNKLEPWTTLDPGFHLLSGDHESIIQLPGKGGWFLALG